MTINGGATTATVFKDGTTNKLGLTVGGGTLALSGASTYTGSTTVLAGTLQAGVATVGGATPTSGAFGKNSAVTLNGGATLDLKGFDETIGSLSDNSGSGGTVTSSVAGTPTLTVGGLNTDTSFAGIIQNGSATSVALTKIGSGTQTLSGVNTYTGDTNINGGNLIVSGSIAGAVNVNSGGTLGAGSGTIGGVTTVETNGTLYPGVTTSTTHPLTLNNNVAFQDGSTYKINLDGSGNSDLLSITGGLTLGSNDTLTLNLISGSLSGTYTIATFTAGETGTFANVDPQIAANSYHVVYGPTSIQLEAVPEPGTWAMMLGGFGTLIVFQRGRRRKMARVS